MIDSNANNLISSHGSRIEEIFAQYISECQYTKRLRQQTIKGYTEVFTTFLKIMPEVQSINDLDAQKVHTFFNRISTRRRVVGKRVEVGIKISTTDTYYRKLMAFFRWLELNEFIPDRSISKKVPRPTTPVYTDDRALSEQEVLKFVATITMHRAESTLAYKRDLAIISLLVYTGIRRGELLGLRIQDVNFETNTLFVAHQTSKSKKDRYIPLHPNLKTVLNEYLMERQQYNLSTAALIISSKRKTAFTEHGLKHWVKKYKKLSGVEFHLHRCRHTFTCNLAKAGADVKTIMGLLGHSSMRMTLRYLRSLKPEDSFQYIKKLPF